MQHEESSPEEETEPRFIYMVNKLDGTLILNSTFYLVGAKMARHTYFLDKIVAQSERELWIKSEGRACETSKHEFCPLKEKINGIERPVDKCLRCGTVRTPRGTYPTIQPKMPKMSKRTKRLTGII
jgi:hypothetical protein